MFDTNLKIKTTLWEQPQKGETTVEYAITITFFILLLLTSVLLLVNPTRSAEESALPGGFKAVADKAAAFGTLPP